MMDNSVDYSKLSPDLQKKIQEWEKQNPTNRQLTVLEDIASITQELLTTLDGSKTDGSKTAKEMGSILLDIRDKLTSLDNKETPETPDYAQPVVDALTKLEKNLGASVRGIDTKPVVNVPKIDAPQVNMDLSAIEQTLKNDLPKAFEEAIKLIPETKIPQDDYTPLINKLEELSQKLESIDNATRIKPQFPNSLKVTNSDGTPISTPGKLVPFAYDSIDITPSTARPTSVVYKAAGTPVATLSITYNGTTSDITNVTRS